MKQLTNNTIKSFIDNRSTLSRGLVRTLTSGFLTLALFTGASLMAKGREADLPDQ